MTFRRAAAALAAFAPAAFAASTALAAPPAIGDSKFGANANSVSMTVYAHGNLEPMSAVVSQRDVHGNVILEIVEGGDSPARPVEIDRGRCERLGPPLYRLPPFTGGQYVTTLKNAKLSTLEDGNHAIVVYGARRSKYACGDLVEPNILRH
jgi:hypothetical protein